MKLSIHHIGARSGSHQFPIIPQLEDGLIYVMYEADSTCVEQIKNRFSESKAEHYIVNEFVGERDKIQKLNINYDPNTSSMLSVDPKYNEFYLQTRPGYDYIVKETFSQAYEVEFATKSIDQICQERNIPFPDFLSLDTQGAEFMILNNASSALDNAVAILTEISFQAIYLNQVLFEDLNPFLRKKGFQFIRFETNFQEFSPLRNPIGLRGRGITVESDALYLRTIESILESSYSDENKKLMLLKLSFICLVFDLFEYGTLCLFHAQKIKIELRRDLNYLKLLKEIEALISSFHVFPKTYSDVFSKEMSSARFVDNVKRSNSVRLKSIIKKQGFFGFIV